MTICLGHRIDVAFHSSIASHRITNIAAPILSQRGRGQQHTGLRGAPTAHRASFSERISLFPHSFSSCTTSNKRLHAPPTWWYNPPTRTHPNTRSPSRKTSERKAERRDGEVNSLPGTYENPSCEAARHNETHLRHLRHDEPGRTRGDENLSLRRSSCCWGDSGCCRRVGLAQEISNCYTRQVRNLASRAGVCGAESYCRS